MERIQRKRTKGFKLPEKTLCINRPGKWGNPLKLIDNKIYIDASYRTKDKWVFLCHGNLDLLLHLYRLLWTDEIGFANYDLIYWSEKFKELDLNELLKYDYLACLCPLNSKCHGDVLIELTKEL